MTDDRPEPFPDHGSVATALTHKMLYSAGTRRLAARRPSVMAWNAGTGGDRTLSAIGALSLCSLLKKGIR